MAWDDLRFPIGSTNSSSSYIGSNFYGFKSPSMSNSKVSEKTVKDNFNKYTASQKVLLNKLADIVGSDDINISFLRTLEQNYLNKFNGIRIVHELKTLILEDKIISYDEIKEKLDELIKDEKKSNSRLSKDELMDLLDIVFGTSTSPSPYFSYFLKSNDLNRNDGKTILSRVRRLIRNGKIYSTETFRQELDHQVNDFKISNIKISKRKQKSTSDPSNSINGTAKVTGQNSVPWNRLARKNGLLDISSSRNDANDVNEEYRTFGIKNRKLRKALNNKRTISKSHKYANSSSDIIVPTTSHSYRNNNQHTKIGYIYQTKGNKTNKQVNLNSKQKKHFNTSNGLNGESQKSLLDFYSINNIKTETSSIKDETINFDFIYNLYSDDLKIHEVEKFLDLSEINQENSSIDTFIVNFLLNIINSKLGSDILSSEFTYLLRTKKIDYKFGLKIKEKLKSDIEYGIIKSEDQIDSSLTSLVDDVSNILKRQNKLNQSLYSKIGNKNLKTSFLSKLKENGLNEETGFKIQEDILNYIKIGKISNEDYLEDIIDLTVEKYSKEPIEKITSQSHDENLEKV